MLSERVESSRLLPTLSIMIDLLLVFFFFFFHPLQISILEVYHGYNAFILTAGVPKLTGRQDKGNNWIAVN